MTITEFLLARIAEDEAAAQAASTGPWVWVGEAAEDSAFLYAGDNEPVIAAYGNHTEGYIECSDADRSYIARHDPARVLAECKAKRAILAEHRPEVETVEWFDTVSDTGTAPVCPSCRPKEPIEWHPRPGEAGVRPEGFVPTYVLAPCPTLQALAAVYANHPDYARVSDTPTKE
jgi:hypothetical protein